MSKIDWKRVVLCGLITGAVWTVLSVIVLALVGDAFILSSTGKSLASLGRSQHFLLFFSNFAAGILVLWFYASVRAQYGAGFKSVLVAGLAWWGIATLQSLKWLVMSVVPTGEVWSAQIAALFTVLFLNLIAILFSTYVGAWIYEKKNG